MPSDTPGHEYACWYPVGTPEGKAALEANLSAGLHQTVTAVESTEVGS
jgi:peptide/nickel transport system ATP-binding protein